MNLLSDEDINKYGFSISSSWREVIISPIRGQPWLTLNHSCDENLLNNGYIIVKHRTNELTAKYKNSKISKDWVLKFCAHHQIEALEINKQWKENQAAGLAAKIAEKENLQIQTKKMADAGISNLAKEAYKNKNTGYRLGANICPVCSGDGGVKRCFKCDGTGWV